MFHNVLNYDTRWHSPEAFKLFVPDFVRKSDIMKELISHHNFDQEMYIKQHLQTQLLKFKRGWLSENGWRNLIHDKDEFDKFSTTAIFDIRNKCKYISKALEFAIKNYSDCGWLQNCQSAISTIQEFESVDTEEFEKEDNYNCRWYITNPKTIMHWYHTFNHHNNQTFINQLSISDKVKYPPFLENNPDIREAIISFCNSNLLEMSTFTVQEYIIGTCLPQLLEQRRKELNNPQLQMEFIMKENNFSTVCRQTVGKWLNLLGFRYCERKKSYYCDSHEKPENVAYRYKYIDRYLEREFKCYRWIQMSKDKYQHLLDRGEVFCGLPYEYKDDHGDDFVEFHVDDCELFSDWNNWPDLDSAMFGGCLSVRFPENAKPMIVFGQDECIFKQYIFTKKSWMGPEGQTAMIPKDEGQGIMMSSFVSRDYGFNFTLMDDQLASVNRMRRGQTYKDVEAAILKRGNADKQDLDCSPFSRKLDYGNSRDGYWSYEDMVLQLEDCVDVLRSINGNKFDYCFLFDHSNGHDRLRPDGLNVNRISKYYGGKQPMMRDTTIKDETYLGPYDHDKKLKVGDTQVMTWISDDVGPYYMSESMKERKKLDKTDGGVKEVDLTVDEMIIALKVIGVTTKGKKDDLVKLCKNNNLPVKKTEINVEEGWFQKPKGAIQILLERGWIYPTKPHAYYTKD